MKVLIIGKSGQLANELAATKASGIDALCVGRTDLDITNDDEVLSFIKNYNPSVIINASAYTAVDKAETESEAAFLINERGVKNLASAAKSINCRFIHVSTDFIFNGESNVAYKLDDSPDPQSVYGTSKLAGEKSVIDTYSEGSSIIRTSWVYSEFGNNFVKTMLRLMSEKEELGIVSDQIGCPTYAKPLAQFIWKLIVLNKFELMYHWSDAGVTSWYDFAVAIQELGFEAGLLSKKISIKPIMSDSYPTPAQRPKFSLLNTEASQCVMESKHWRTQLKECIKNLS